MKHLRAILVLLVALSMIAQAQISDIIRINGYGSVEFEKMFQDRGRGDLKGSFDSDGFDLVLNITPAERFRIAADLNWEHGTSTELNFGNTGYEYIFAEYTVSDLLKIRAGKQFISFGIVNEIHTAKPALLTIKEPSATVRTDRVGGPVFFYPRWGTGLSMTGDGNFLTIPFDYIVQLTNGDHSFGNPFEKDYDKTKALNGRLRGTVWREGGNEARVGASFYSDSGDSLAVSSFGAQVQGIIGNFGIDVEYMSGSYEPYKKPSISRFGYYVQAAYTFDSRFTPYVRWESYDPNDGKSDDEANVLVGGLNLAINDYLFLKIEIDRFLSSVQNPRHKGVNYTELKSSVSFGF